MTPTSRQVILDANPRHPDSRFPGPRMVLESYPVDTNRLPVDAARAELAGGGTRHYIPAFLTRPEVTAPWCHRLDQALRDLFEREVATSFIRVNPGQPGMFYGQLHVDVKFVAGTPHFGNVCERGHNRQIVRHLVNLHPSEGRTVEYVDESRAELAARHVNPETLRPVGCDTADVPGDVVVSSVTIPPLKADRIHVLTFWSGRVIHAGVTGSAGHYMAALARYGWPRRPL